MSGGAVIINLTDNGNVWVPPAIVSFPWQSVKITGVVNQDYLVGTGITALIVTSSATTLNFAFTFPPSPVDGQEFSFIADHIITNLVANAGAGQSLFNPEAFPMTLAAKTALLFYWNAADGTWYPKG